MSKLFAAVLLATLFFTSIFGAPYVQAQQTAARLEAQEAGIGRIREMKSAAVQIGYMSDGPHPVPHLGIPTIPDMRPKRAGTVFFVSNQGYVLTAGHVIKGTMASATNAGATKVEFKVGILLDLSSNSNAHFRGSFKWVDAAVVEIDDVHDLALLKVAQNPFNGEVPSGIVTGEKKSPLPLNVSIAKLNPALPPEGKDLLVSGYPLDIPTFVSQKGMVSSESYSSVEIHPPGAPAGFLVPQVVDMILLDAVVNPGNSGGPVYDYESGDVVGICEGYENSPLYTNKHNPVTTGPEEYLVQNAGLAAVIPIEYGIELLKKNGVSGVFIAGGDPSK
jgi:S1-C subfamily serine protease